MTDATDDLDYQLSGEQAKFRQADKKLWEKQVKKAFKEVGVVAQPDTLQDNFLLESPYTDSFKGVISSVMIRVSGIKNKYGCPEINPPEMNKELDEVFFTANKALADLFMASGRNFLKSIGEEDKIQAWEKYLKNGDQ